MTEAQWKKVVERLHKYREVKIRDNEVLILWDNGDVSLRDCSDGFCIICTRNLDEIKRIVVD